MRSMVDDNFLNHQRTSKLKGDLLNHNHYNQPSHGRKGFRNMTASDDKTSYQRMLVCVKESCCSRSDTDVL
jgi:hypothetical protein